MNNLLLPLAILVGFLLLRKKGAATSTPPPGDLSNPRLPAGVAPILARVRSHIMANKTGKGYFNLDPDIVLAQSILETGWFKSRLASEQNNIFGMMQPRKRPTTSTGAGPSGFATYATIADSVEDYFLRQRYFKIPDSPDAETYIRATKDSGYATDPQYVDKVLRVYRMLK
jgi:flagellum-specific peptidoglycan hydrolase FlgJ